jgi:hypothetical protein
VMGRLIILNPSQNTLEAVAKRATGSGRLDGGGLGPVQPSLITPEIYGDCPCPSDYSEIYLPRPLCWMMMYGDRCQWATNGEWVDCNSGDYYYDITFDSTWSSSNTSVATVDSAGKVTAVGPGSTTLGGFYADFMYSGPRCTTDVIGRHGDDGVSVYQVQITSADITQDRIVVTLSGPQGDSANLDLRITGPNGRLQEINTGTSPLSPGTYTFSFGLDTISDGEYTTISALWSPNDYDVTDTFSYHFKVLGTFRQTQYNSPHENNCSGDPVTVTFWNPSCQSTDYNNVKNGFWYRVTYPGTATGSGHSIFHGDVLLEAYCSVGSRDLRANATITGTLGSLSNSTVAACWDNPELYQSGRRVYIRGLGVKTVTDSCPSCCGDWDHLDNYTTSTACSLDSLANALTIILY